MRGNNTENEVERRRKVAEEKMMGAFIELVDKMRKMARSIAFRLLLLSQSIYDFQQTVKAMGSSVDLNEPTINEVTKTLFMMGTNISQILSYMLRWIE